MHTVILILVYSCMLSCKISCAEISMTCACAIIYDNKNLQVKLYFFNILVLPAWHGFNFVYTAINVVSYIIKLILN